MSADLKCPFCNLDPERIAFEWSSGWGIWDGFPVSPGHALIIPKRHAATWDDLTDEEKAGAWSAVDRAILEIRKKHTPDGFNVGFNFGRASGQTVFHFHLHVIPRYAGDLADPRGGVRNVIPAKGNYLATTTPERASYISEPHRKALISGGEDALVQHLLPHIDQSHSLDLVVSFILTSGIRLLQPRIQELLDRGGRVRIVTGDYLDVTEPTALRRLLDLKGNVQRLVFQSNKTSFHPKSWIFYFGNGGGIAVVGSSNLSEAALRSGIEWNLRLYDRADVKSWNEVVSGFENLLERPELKELTNEWIDDYEFRRIPPTHRERGFAEVVPEPPLDLPIPHGIQQRALSALKETRLHEFTAGLVVLATGLGKTWLSAFDSENFERVLFVAHREEILAQAQETFRRVRPHARFGFYTGNEKDLHADVLFASIQTLGRSGHLRKFEPSAFDYIVVDEFHHAAAPTYRTLIDHFTPKFFLGLTATPERTDGGDLLALCQENLVFRCDLFEGISEDLLSPFKYFGIADDVDYEQIPWRSSFFDEKALTQALATQQRAQNAFEQYRARNVKKTIGFCCSISHADFMATFFKERGLRAVAIHSGGSSAPRTTALEQLKSGDLDIVFSVDMLNEGVDIPSVDSVLMLRPTESTIIWLQQFGRGLRKAPGKEELIVIDYIGNHRIFLTKAKALLQLGEGDRALALALEAYQAGRLELPPGCAVTYDLKAIEILQKMLRPTTSGDALEVFYLDFQQRHGTRPTALEARHANHQPGQTGHGSWLAFVEHMDGLTAEEKRTFAHHRSFFNELEKTRMTKSYKMLLLKAMLAENQLPGHIDIDRLARRFVMIAERNPQYRKDVTKPLSDIEGVKRLLIENPIDALTQHTNKSDSKFFDFSGDTFSTSIAVAPADLASFKGLATEIIDWRLGDYLGRGSSAPEQTSGSASPGQLQLWTEYDRSQIPAFFGASFNRGSWNAGMVTAGNSLILLVTLQKGNLAAGNEYADRFIDANSFEWQTQNQTTQTSKHGKIISGAVPGSSVELFVRTEKLRAGKAAPFIYCGPLTFTSWHGEKPISVVSSLSTSVPDRLKRLLRVPTGK